MLEAKREKHLSVPGTWCPSIEVGTHVRHVWLTCPGGHVVELRSDEIGADGATVVESCSAPGCDFRGDVRLEGWSP